MSRSTKHAPSRAPGRFFVTLSIDTVCASDHNALALSKSTVSLIHLFQQYLTDGLVSAEAIDA